MILSLLKTRKTMTTASDRRIDGLTQSPPGHLIDHLRTSLVGAISDFKAYDVPGICSRIGLADGTDDEAYSSKNKYVSKRLASLPWNEVLGATRKLLLSIDDFHQQHDEALRATQYQPTCTVLRHSYGWGC